MKNRPFAPTIGLLLIVISVSCVTAYAQRYPCLPHDIMGDTVVGIDPKTDKPTTADAALKKIRARCSRGSLVDRKGRKIKFFQLQGCWGNPPADYLDVLEQQRIALEKLKKKYTVIEIPCSTDPRSISSTGRRSMSYGRIVP
jgi:hypothetical protein